MGSSSKRRRGFGRASYPALGFIGLLVSTLVALVLPACSSDSEPVTRQRVRLTQRQLTIRLPQGVEPKDVALSATDRLTLADRVRVRESTAALSMIANVGEGTTELGADSNVGNVYSRGNAFLRSRAFVGGFLRTRGDVTQQDGVTVVGGIESGATFDPISLAGWTIGVPDVVSGNLELEPDTASSAVPGRYGNVSVKSRATLSLAPGIYVFDQLILEPQSTIELDQSSRLTEIYVLSSLIVRGAFAEKAGREAFPIVGFLGTSTAFVEVNFRGVIVAPDATLVLGANRADYTGSFYAKQIEVRPDTVITHRPFNLPGGDIVTSTDPPQRDLPDPVTTPAADCGPRRGLAVTAWAMRGFCPAHLGQSPFLGTRTNYPRWVFESDGEVRAQPIVGSRSTVYFGTLGGSLYAVDRGGQQRWRLDVGSPIHGSPALSSRQVLYFGADDGAMRAVDRRGALVWTTDLQSFGDQTVPPFIRSSPAIDDAGTIYVGTNRGVVAALGADGSLRWTRELTGAVSSSVALDAAGLLFAATEAGNAYALDRSTGTVVWTRSGLGALRSSPSLSVDGRLYIGSADGNLYALERSNGNVAWSVATGGAVDSSPAIAPNGNVVVGSASGEVRSITPAGAVSWTANLGSSVVSSPAISADGVIYLASSAGQVVALGMFDGEPIWQRALPAGVQSSPAIVSEGYVVIGSDDGRVHAIGNEPAGGIGLEPGANGGCGPSPFGAGYDHSLANAPNAPPPPASGLCSSGIPFGPQVSDDLPGGASDGFDNGHERCATDASGLGGLAYDSEAQMLVLRSVPAPAPGCELRFCTDDETPITLTLEDLNRNPNTLPTPTSCDATAPQRHCPIDPATVGATCTSDSDCNVGAGEKCAVSCDNASCETYSYRCGRPRASCDSVLGEEPTGPFDPNDPSETTWPCQEHRECAETTPGISYTGDPALAKTGSLEKSVLPDVVRSAPVPLPAYPSVVDTLFQQPCGLDSDVENGLEAFDPRSGGNGNSKWGVFIEPQIGFEFDVNPGTFFGDASFSGNAGASLVAGANVWGKRIEAVNANFSAEIGTCSFSTTKSLKVLGEEYLSVGDDDWSGRPDVATIAACEAALAERDKFVGALAKATRDAKAAADYVRRHGLTEEFCDRTALVFGDFDPGCTTASLERWFSEYAFRATQLEAFHFGSYAARLGALETESEIPLYIGDTQFTGLGAAMFYPVGPITVEMEIEVAGAWGLGGALKYGIVSPVSNDIAGPYAHVEAGPRASALAFVYVGAGIGGVTVGVLGELELLSFTTPLFAGFGLSRETFVDPRNPASSGLFGPASLNSLFGGKGIAKWRSTARYGAGLELSTLSGQIDLAVRIRLLFFKKTFRKKIAKWDGFSKRYEFVGELGSPSQNTSEFDYALPTVPFPAVDNTQVFSEGVLAPEVPLNELGPADFPGQCGTPPACLRLGSSCERDDDCCSNYCTPVGRVCDTVDVPT